MENKYFDYIKKKEINTLTDGCSFNSYVNNKTGDALFAIHDSGVKIFLQPEKLSFQDEYRNGDPYSFERNFNSDFHSSRIVNTIELLKAICNPSQNFKILDFGCGEGIISNKIQKEFPNSEISGFDYSISAILKAHSLNDKIDFIVADAFNLPYSKKYFDVVIMNNIYEHIPNPVDALIRIKKNLKPMGFLIISTPNRYRANNVFNVLTGRPIHFMSKMHVTEYSIGQIKEQLEYSGYHLMKKISKSIQERGNSFKGKIYYNIFIPLLKKYLKKCHSHHVLDSTIFYLAKVK